MWRAREFGVETLRPGSEHARPPRRRRTDYGPEVDDRALVIADRPEADRYEARLGSDLAGFIDYRRMGGRLVLIHTETLPAFERQGVASAMAHHVLDEARSRQDRVTIKCPYLHDFVERHPEYRPAGDGRIPEGR